MVIFFYVGANKIIEIELFQIFYLCGKVFFSDLIITYLSVLFSEHG